MTTTIGIDPGTKGAVAVIENGQLACVYSIPILGPAGDRIVDVCELRDLLARDRRGDTTATIERAQVMAGPTIQIGRKAAFTYSGIYHAILACVTLSGIPYRLVAPQAWRRRLPGSPRGRKETKRAIERVVRERLPGLPKLKQDHLDAIFLALLD